MSEPRWQVLGERRPASGEAVEPYAAVGVRGFVQAEFEGLERARAFCWDMKARLGPLCVVDRRSFDGRQVEIVYGTGP